MSEVEEKGPCLEGVRVDNNHIFSSFARARQKLTLQPGCVTYSVICEAAAKPLERRRAARVATRLSSGKILNARGEFLTECTFRNRTAVGVRLKLARDIAMPSRVLLYDDRSGALQWLDVVWRGEGEIGCKTASRQAAPDPRLQSRFRQPFYAIR